jgi:hypothetical protein
MHFLVRVEAESLFPSVPEWYVPLHQENHLYLHHPSLLGILQSTVITTHMH